MICMYTSKVYINFMSSVFDLIGINTVASVWDMGINVLFVLKNG